ncbi:hypothetical protein [Lignipirellula cremea]|uniref:Tetratricopeptide repeat protein n=1 Tax=Lignipirellula cremea TaxID=2528010 RepID=A0A518DNE1_9BACT|nr:hypothetical protein [Lignipirellula cremea]QDU93354.1 Tetratricopeptide repeat protein [Lignipirellula cremea]
MKRRTTWHAAWRSCAHTAAPLLLLVSCMTTFLPAASGEPLEALLRADLLDGRLDDLTLLEAALIAGGIDDTRALNHHVEAFARVEAALRRELPDTASPQERAEIVFRFLHTNVLTGPYARDCMQVERSLRGEEYNCVTATILYQSLAAAADLPTIAVSTPGHVFCRIPGDRDIETTCPDWFDRTESVSPLSSRARRDLNAAQLLAKVYYNRSVLLLGRGKFSPATRYLSLSISLDPHDADALENQCAAYNNWALECAAAGQYAKACSLLEQGRRINPYYEHFARNERHIRLLWTQAEGASAPGP